jgi:hypothetical protein
LTFKNASPEFLAAVFRLHRPRPTLLSYVRYTVACGRPRRIDCVVPRWSRLYDGRAVVDRARKFRIFTGPSLRSSYVSCAPNVARLRSIHRRVEGTKTLRLRGPALDCEVGCRSYVRAHPDTQVRCSRKIQIGPISIERPTPIDNHCSAIVRRIPSRKRAIDASGSCAHDGVSAVALRRLVRTV